MGAAVPFASELGCGLLKEYLAGFWLSVLLLTTLKAHYLSVRTETSSHGEKKPLPIFVQLLYNHGDRAPSSFIGPKDPYVNSFPQGIGQLTTRGWEQQYALGQFLRARYSELLNLDTTGLSYADVYIRSTDVERAIASAQANNAAFFRPPSSAPSSNKKPGTVSTAWQTPDSDLNKVWQPVPIHTVPERDDWVMHIADCEQINVQKNKFENSEEIQTLKKTPDVQALFRGLTYITGEPLNYWTISKTFKSVADTLHCEHAHNMLIPKVPHEFYAAVEELLESTSVMQYGDRDTAKLSGGCLLNTLAQNMRNKLDSAIVPKDKKTDDPYVSRKLVVFSGHDTNLLGVISAAGLLDKAGAKPPYAASLYFELFADGMVEILYKNDTSSLNAIRTGQAVPLLKASLGELENMWQGARVTDAQYQKLCQG